MARKAKLELLTSATIVQRTGRAAADLRPKEVKQLLRAVQIGASTSLWLSVREPFLLFGPPAVGGLVGTLVKKLHFDYWIVDIAATLAVSVLAAVFAFVIAAAVGSLASALLLRKRARKWASDMGVQREDKDVIVDAVRHALYRSFDEAAAVDSFYSYLVPQLGFNHVQAMPTLMRATHTSPNSVPTSAAT